MSDLLNPLLDKELLGQNYYTAIQTIQNDINTDHSLVIAERYALQISEEGDGFLKLLDIDPITFNNKVKEIALGIASEVLKYLIDNSGEIEKETPDPQFLLVLSTIISREGVSSSTGSISGDGQIALQNHQRYLDIMLPIILKSFNAETARILLGDWADKINLHELLKLSLDRNVDSVTFKSQFAIVVKEIASDIDKVNELFGIFIKFLNGLGTYALLQTKDIVEDLLANIITTTIGFQVMRRSFEA